MILEESNEEKIIIAVVKSWEGHSLFSFDILLPFHDANPNWGNQRCQTLFRIYPNCDIKALKQRLSEYEVQQDGHNISNENKECPSHDFTTAIIIFS